MAQRIIRSLFQFVGLMHRGKVEEKCNAELRRLIEALEQHPDEKASGSITITLTVTKLGDRLDHQPKIETKLPKEKGFGSVTSWTSDGGLSLEHPSQSDMFGPRDTARSDRETA